MKHTWKKTTAFIMAMALVAGFAPANVGGFLTGGTAIVANAAASDKPNDIADKYTIDGVNYYKVNSDNFNKSDKLFFMDMVTTPLSSLDNKSLAESWALLASQILKTDGKLNEVGFDSATLINDDNYKQGGYIQLMYTKVVDGGSLRIFYFADLYDFSVTPLIPDAGVEGNYVVNTVNSTPVVKPSFSEVLRNDTGETGTFSVELGSSYSASYSSTIDHSFTYDFRETLSVSAENDWVIGTTTIEAGFEAGQAISDGWSKTEETSKSYDKMSSYSRELPPYTVAVVNQSESATEVTTNYNCPISLNYKVRIRRSPKAGSKTCSFGDKNNDARKDLYNRAIIEGGAKNLDPNSIDWVTILSNSETKDLVDKLTSTVVMSPVGASFHESLKTTTLSVDRIVPIYPLSRVTTDTDAIAMTIGEENTTKNFDVKGLNIYNAPYYGFNPEYGHWIVVDEDGKEFSNTYDSPIKLVKNAFTGQTSYKAVKTGNCYLKYVIDEKSYSSQERSDRFTKNSDLSNTAMIEVTVTQAGADKVYSKQIGDKTVKVRGAFTGTVGNKPEKIEDDGKLEVSFFDDTEMEIEPDDYIWVKQELKGITLDSNGNVQFSKEGTYHVQLRSPDKKTIYSEWIPITAIAAGEPVDEPDEPIPFVDADADSTFEITGGYTGLVGAEPDSIEGGEAQVIYFDDNGVKYGKERLSLTVCDATGMEINASHTWEAQETDGITITEDGKVSFTKEGIYHVRVKSGDYYSDWVEITAKPESAEYSAIYFDGTSVNLDPIYNVYGTAITPPADPTMKGYIFKGWSPEFPTTMPADTIALTAQWEIDDSAERVLIKGNVRGAGQLAVSENGEEPVFDEAYPITSLNNNTVKGESLIFSAKPDDGWKFIEWQDRATGEVYSKDATITITADVPLDLIAVFDAEDSAEYVLISGNVRGAGHLAVSENGDAPVFDEDHPATSLYNNVVKGDTLIYSAKADEGWVFKEWQHKATGEVYSKDATITITADTPLDLVAVFDTEDAVTEHKLTDAEMMQWTAKDYKDKTGTDANVAITGWSDDEYEITITDDDDKVLDTYKINPDTGIGTNEAGEEVNLPQTGMSGAHKALAGLAALMTIAGFGLVKKSRKKDKE